MSTSERTKILAAGAVFLVLFTVGIIVAMHHQDDGQQQIGRIEKAQPLDPPTIAPPAIHSNRPVQISVEQTSVQARAQSVIEIYNGLHHGMLESGLQAIAGKPDSDTVIGRPLLYGGDNSEAIEETRQNIPQGRFDGGDTRMLVYKDGQNTVSVILISTLDAEHPRTGLGQPIWVVNQYILR